MTAIMNPGMKVIYQGELRNNAQHLRSGNTLTTDAPLDNNGKGEAFSPTDLLCTSLATCMMTLIGIAAQSKGIAIGNMEAEIEKVMASNPRRVSEIHIAFTIQDMNFGEREKAILENAALTCPVAKSLHPDIQQQIGFNYSK
jgi:uncharacterized OsmC-like protein